MLCLVMQQELTPRIRRIFQGHLERQKKEQHTIVLPGCYQQLFPAAFPTLQLHETWEATKASQCVQLSPSKQASDWEPSIQPSINNFLSPRGDNKPDPTQKQPSCSLLSYRPLALVAQVWGVWADAALTLCPPQEPPVSMVCAKR